MVKIKRTVFDVWKVNNEMWVSRNHAAFFTARGWEICPD
jgi:hypothetical protein